MNSWQIVYIHGQLLARARGQAEVSELIFLTSRDSHVGFLYSREKRYHCANGQKERREKRKKEKKRKKKKEREIAMRLLIDAKFCPFVSS